ncbi:TolC family outer membrane protein [Roseicella aquatilis]|uniref:Secretion protein n=1 Tax=Roseicella aquatilis TaxID=2527868 RepID=A0A4R4D7F3_9PROT|nr:TolC family outer membrane protein [Roseicella aquatilis]TCZ54998.1 secretion protein [Roseicella aquatilis]
MRPTRSALALATALLAPAALSLGSSPAASQTLRDALAQAYANNPSLLAARAQLRAVDENVPQALAGWRPQVSVGVSGGPVDSRARTLASGFDPNTFEPITFGRTTRIERQLFTSQVTVTQPIFRGGRTVASTRRAENQVLGQRARLLATEQQVMSDSVNAYVSVIRDQELLRLNINNEQVLTEQLRATNERFRVGEITRTDVAQAESRLANARAQRSQAEGQLQISRATFLRVIGSRPERLIAPQPLRPPVGNALEAGQAASTNNPTVVALLFDEAAARDAVNVQVSALMPQVSVQGQAFRSDNAASPNTRITGAQVVAQLTVPIYQGGAEYAAVRQARQTAQQARSQVEDQRRTVTQSATQAWEQLISARAQVDAQRAAIRASEIALDGVQREAIVGSRTTLEVLNQEQELLQNRTNLVQALATVVAQSYTLAGAIGRLTAQDLGLEVDLYDSKAYYNAVRNRWFGLGDYSDVAERR